MFAIALPDIGRYLEIPEYRLQWLVSAYALSSVDNLWTLIHRRNCEIGVSRFPDVFGCLADLCDTVCVITGKRGYS